MYQEKEIVNLKDIQNKFQDKTKRQFKIYTDYIKEFFKTQDQDVIDMFLKDREKLLIYKNCLYKEDIDEIVKNKTKHTFDNRTPEELLTTLLLHEVLEKTTIMEGLTHNEDICSNPLASKDDLIYQNSEPDLCVMLCEENLVELEQQTSIKEYPHIYCKEHKIDSLRHKSNYYGREIYILQKAIIDGKALYAAINVNEEFVPTTVKMDGKTEKVVLISVKEVEYKPLIEVLQDISVPFLLEQYFNEQRLDDVLNRAKNKASEKADESKNQNKNKEYDYTR